jgi:N-methylhydantoinase A
MGYDFSQGIVAPLHACGDRFVSEASRLVGEARKRFGDDAPQCNNISFELRCDLRYVGQAHEMSLRLLGGTENQVRDGLASLVDTAREQFHEAHHERYGYADREREIELVSLRIRATARGEDETIPRSAFLPGNQIRRFAIREAASLPNVGQTIAWFRSVHGPARVTTPVLERSSVPHESRIGGPAVLLSDDATTIVPPAWEAVKDSTGNLLLRMRQASEARILR